MASNTQPHCQCKDKDCSAPKSRCSCRKNERPCNSDCECDETVCGFKKKNRENYFRVRVWIGNDLVLVPCLDGQISVSKVMTIAQNTYKNTFKVDIPVAYLRCNGAVINSKDKLADAVRNDSVLVACSHEDETATTTNSNSSRNMPISFGRPALGELLQGVEPGGLINRDGRTAVRDRTAEKLSQANKATLATRSKAQAKVLPYKTVLSQTEKAEVLLKLKSWKVKPTQIETDLLTDEEFGMDQCQKQEAQKKHVQLLEDRLAFLAAEEKDPILQEVEKERQPPAKLPFQFRSIREKVEAQKWLAEERKSLQQLLDQLDQAKKDEAATKSAAATNVTEPRMIRQGKRRSQASSHSVS